VAVGLLVGIGIAEKKEKNELKDKLARSENLTAYNLA
jgi:hypothetical protein